MQKSKLLAALQSEIRRHNFSTFYKKGVVVPGCPPCGKRLNTHRQFIDHLAEEVLPGLLDRLSSQTDISENERGRTAARQLV
jgi:hypothetical protein